MYVYYSGFTLVHVVLMHLRMRIVLLLLLLFAGNSDSGLQIIHLSLQLGQFLVEAGKTTSDGSVECIQEIRNSLQRT